MIAQAHSATLIGIEALPIVVETDLLGPIADGTSQFGEVAFVVSGSARVWNSAVGLWAIGAGTAVFRDLDGLCVLPRYLRNYVLQAAWPHLPAAVSGWSIGARCHAEMCILLRESLPGIGKDNATRIVVNADPVERTLHNFVIAGSKSH